jgi:hypothetical protein
VVSLILLAATSLAPLSPIEQRELVDGYAVYRICQPFVNNEGQVYVRQLKYNASQANREAGEFFSGMERAVVENLVVPDSDLCHKELPKAFKALELFKRFK